MTPQPNPSLPCPECDGNGWLWHSPTSFGKDECGTCHGSGTADPGNQQVERESLPNTPDLSDPGNVLSMDGMAGESRRRADPGLAKAKRVKADFDANPHLKGTSLDQFIREHSLAHSNVPSPKNDSIHALPSHSDEHTPAVGFEQELDVAFRWLHGPKADHAKREVLAAHNQALYDELQALASSDNWKLRLEDRMMEIKVRLTDGR